MIGAIATSIAGALMVWACAVAGWSLGTDRAADNNGDDK
jgi:hypothetical protein